MKLLVLICLILSTKTFGNIEAFPKKLSDLYSTLDEVPYLHSNNTITGIAVSEFTLEYSRSTVDEHGIVTYGAYIPSTDPECDEDDYFAISLYTFENTVKFALPMRQYACHED